MNVVLNTDEANAVMSLVTAQAIDHADLTEAGKKAVREWRRHGGAKVSDCKPER